ncbi:MAG: alanine racemase, partial [Candidatus Omnitrophota bacterium]|nr:alanine racemase [Candidatus Omnitrophota bacterium]
RRPRAVAILAVIKADAYGHGMLRIASELDKLGADFLAVSDVAEGVQLRKHGIKKPVVLLESSLPFLAKQIVDYGLTPTVCHFPLASAIQRYASSVNKKVDVHVKVDTGMGRMGVRYEEAENFIKCLAAFPSLRVRGLYTHFPVADTDTRFTRRQINDLTDLVRRLDHQALVIPYIHAANSMGLGRYRMPVFNVARPGLMLYGLYPAENLRPTIRLKPVMSVKTRAIFVKHIPKGAGVSYGHTFVAKRRMTVATLPIGYQDGYFRCLSNKSCALVRGQRCPLIGRVTMDQIVVDVTGLKNVRLGEEVVMLGAQGRRQVSADELADHAGTISYEIVCNLGNRLPRVYLR